MYVLNQKQQCVFSLVSVITTVISPLLYKTKKGWLHVVMYTVYSRI
jgi:hypothetical protein